MFQTAVMRGSNAIERWVQRIAKTSGQRVDWHFAGGRVMVLALGDLDRTKAAIREHMPEHDALFFGDDTSGRARPYRPAWWTDDDAKEVDTAPRLVSMPDGPLALYDPDAVAIIEAFKRAGQR